MRRSKKSPTTLIGIVTILVLLALAYWIKVHKNRLSAGDESEQPSDTPMGSDDAPENVIIPEEPASTEIQPMDEAMPETSDAPSSTPQSDLESVIPEYNEPQDAAHLPLAEMPESGAAPLLESYGAAGQAESPETDWMPNAVEDAETQKDKSMLEELLAKVKELPAEDRKMVLNELAPKQELRTYMDKEDLRDVCRAIEAERESLGVHDDPEASPVEPT